MLVAPAGRPLQPLCGDAAPHHPHLQPRLLAACLALPARLQVKILRADRDVYAAEIEGKEGNKLLMKIGPGDFNPRGDDWSIADCGQGWSVWEGKAAPAPAPAARPAAAPRKRAAASKAAAAASKPVEQSEQ